MRCVSGLVMECTTEGDVGRDPKPVREGGSYRGKEQAGQRRENIIASAAI